VTLRIENADDASGTVRRYITGTRSRHGKIASITIEADTQGPDQKGVWTIKGTYVTEEGDSQEFVASVTSKGEVLMSSIPPSGDKNTTQRGRR